MDAWYHFSSIASLLITQSLDGERTPMFKVTLEPHPTPVSMKTGVDNPADHLYVFGIGQKYAYLSGNLVDDKDAYRDVMSEHLKFKTRKTPA